ncbi:Uncharacterised protein [Mycoplasmopsis columboralis]|uniref:Uncharacterized protein n=1 Tax=Mycoplasmopsis columboralis TaxID=171282 RepID=A0A449B5I4_9BACT|nr:Uncharacterised protein [Mycoplasmopsis columboralis]
MSQIILVHRIIIKIIDQIILETNILSYALSNS